MKKHNLESTGVVGLPGDGGATNFIHRRYEMEKFIKLASLFLVCIFLSGCYASQIPLSNYKDSTIDDRIINRWVLVTERGVDYKIKLAVLRFNDNEYFICWKDTRINDTGYVTTLARGFTTEMGKINIMNVQFLSDTKKENEIVPYFFFKYSFNEKGNLLINLLPEEFFKDEKFETSKQLYEFIERNIDNRDLFDDDAPIEFEPADIFGIEINEWEVK
jgi:hypothetical protein